MSPRARRTRGPRGGRPGPRILDAVLLSLPLLALFLWLLGSAVLGHHRLSRFHDWWTVRTPDVPAMLGRRLKLARYAPEASALEERLAGRAGLPRALSLAVDPRAWDAMDRDAAASWGEWIEAELQRFDGPRPLELRLRGDASAHWSTEKKSLALKAERGTLLLGLRRPNLTVKDVLPEYVAAELAREAGLLVPANDLREVFVNGRYHGLYRLLGRPDEGFLRRQGRMPGDLWRGEALQRGDAFAHLDGRLFVNPRPWERTAQNDRPAARGERNLEEWIALLNGSTLAEHRLLMERLDAEELARLLAVMLACGDLHHMSDYHNQYWYDDPATGVLHPVVWDLLMRPLDASLWDLRIPLLWHALLRDPRLFDRALVLAVGERIERGPALARAAAERHADALAYDRRRAEVVAPMGSPELVEGVLRNNRELLEGWARDARVRFCAAPAQGGSQVLDLLAEGRVGGVFEGLALADEPAREPRLVADRDGDGAIGPGDRALATELGRGPDGEPRLLFAEPERLLAGCAPDGPWLVPEPLAYRFVLEGAVAREPLLRAPFGGEPLSAEPWERGTPIPAARSWHPWLLEREPPGERRLSGLVRLDQDLCLAPGEALVIEPGTTLALGPDVSIVARGPVRALGEERRPIELRRADPERPWGSLLLLGPEASGSRFAHARFTGGGGALVERVEVKGMVAVHEARDVRFERCAFADNARCDDLFNAVRAEVWLTGCSFTNANADALDLDLSGGTIEGCRIEGARNDGIDLMGSDARILATRIRGAGDKGLSIGEDSAPLVWGSSIEGCGRGLEVKDLSAPLVLDTRVAGNGLGLLQRRKSAYYGGGGRALLGATPLGENARGHEAEDGSFLTLVGAEQAQALEALRLLAGVAEGRAARVVASGSFGEEWDRAPVAWRPLGRVAGLGVRERELVALVCGGEGGMGLALEDGALPAIEGQLTLLVEVSGKELGPLRVAARTAAGDARASCTLPQEASLAGLFALPLPAAPRALALMAEPSGRRGELRLHRWWLLEERAAR